MVSFACSCSCIHLLRYWPLTWISHALTFAPFHKLGYRTTRPWYLFYNPDYRIYRHWLHCTIRSIYVSRNYAVLRVYTTTMARTVSQVRVVSWQTTPPPAMTGGVTTVASENSCLDTTVHLRYTHVFNQISPQVAIFSKSPNVWSIYETSRWMFNIYYWTHMY